MALLLSALAVWYISLTDAAFDGMAGGVERFESYPQHQDGLTAALAEARRIIEARVPDPAAIRSALAYACRQYKSVYTRSVDVKTAAVCALLAARIVRT